MTTRKTPQSILNLVLTRLTIISLARFANGILLKNHKINSSTAGKNEDQ
jgi:hypothetical protein